MKAVLVFTALLAVLSLMAIACQDGEEAPASPTLTPAGTASPAATAAASPTPEAAQQPRLIFLRPQLGPSSEPPAVIHMSDLSGSNVIQLTPADVSASFVGLAERDGTAVVYYVAGDDITNVFTLEARDLVTGQTTTLASVEPKEGHPLSGSLSPDGRYVAFDHYDGIDVLDLTTDAQRRILDSERPGCETIPLGECYAYSDPRWSADGRLLLVQKTFWEGGAAVIVDPFQEAPQEMGESFLGSPSPTWAAWSPASDAICGYGLYDSPSGLYVSSEPEWEFRNLLPEYETYVPDAPEYYNVRDCAWLDEDRIAFATTIGQSFGYGSETSSTISIYEVATSEMTVVADFGPEPLELFPVPGTDTIVYNDRNSGQPGLLQTSNGDRAPLLEPGDQVLAVTQPIDLPEDIVAATPEVEPCVPLTPQCEAQVTNVGSEGLNIREAPRLGDVVGQLSEGDVVCLTGLSLFTEGYRWWPVRSQEGLEGWAAQGDPQEPDQPWLTATAQKCEE